MICVYARIRMRVYAYVHRKRVMAFYFDASTSAIYIYVEKCIFPGSFFVIQHYD